MQIDRRRGVGGRGFASAVRLSTGFDGLARALFWTALERLRACRKAVIRLCPRCSSTR